VSAWTVADVQRAVASATGRAVELPGHGRAAILVPVLDAPAGPALLFTVRAAALARHAGQVSFPGGRVEAGESVVAAALREAYEEVGLVVDPDDVFGVLDDRTSPFALVATPVVARVRWPAELRLDLGEVAEVFTLSLARLRAAPEVRETRVHEGVLRELHRYDVDGRCVWGLTGNVVKDLLDRLEAAAPPSSSAPC
jgi:8-oxo-dGTP pyrophosphatase MutT (NUDIX family)